MLSHVRPSPNPAPPGVELEARRRTHTGEGERGQLIPGADGVVGDVDGWGEDEGRGTAPPLPATRLTGARDTPIARRAAPGVWFAQAARSGSACHLPDLGPPALG